ncbi:non-canonical purine NTP pyrophosphatase [Hyalangium gracile]|uniref:non-canonical purine NTP pyrophosphatase n=1 Tax=Hyalangium gracile TaxID=394092 RepID=UPI001CCB5BB7|nr:non-canonical purine NTP pyrophosphatase [Hyalangium gracile]
MPTIYFSTSNEQKYEDVKQCFLSCKNPPRMLWQKVPEMLSGDLEEVVRTKALEAYKRAQVPLFVEHGGLYIEYLKQLPGPLVKPFWEALEGDLCAIIPPGASRRAHVIQQVCYCDGRKLQVFEGRIDGRIADQKEGTGIHWEPVFIPDGQHKTMGQMSIAEKVTYSGNAKAYAQLRRALRIR